MALRKLPIASEPGGGTHGVNPVGRSLRRLIRARTADDGLDFVFGYGSLINAASRADTWKSDAIPCIVDGIERGWNVHVPEQHATSLGVLLNPEATCNGVVSPIPQSELPKCDDRESYYTRVLLPVSAVTAREELPQGARIWTYIAKEPAAPTPECPIVQSYVDVCLAGCLSIGEEFAREFVTQTQGWKAPWLDDRHDWLYRAGDRPLVEQIDALLRDMVPEAFTARAMAGRATTLTPRDMGISAL